MMLNTPSTLDQQVLAQAVDWLLKLQSEETSPATLAAFEHWQSSHPQHAEAWSRLTQIQQTFGQVPHKALAKQVLARIDHTSRRQALKKLGTLVIVLPSAWLGYRTLPLERWRAGYQTAVGEQKHLHLGDGTRLVLNTDSAVDIQYHQERKIVLHQGEVWLETGHQDKRKLVVITPHGELVPLGTRFNVKLTADRTILAVTEGAVRIQLDNGQSSVVQAGQQRAFNRHGLEPARVADQSVGYWQQGMLLAQAMPLEALLKELARYRHGVIRCHPELRQMTVSGAFPLKDTDAALDLLQKTLPVKVVAPSRYWIMIEPASAAG
ncbi:FecR domain-containing protein [Methylophilus sp. QUAN]|uniref:FecR domain-containing protein n=1 Tax=Methylophilus sp. QUAN TaxID=2781020 RepID=UPI0018905692|nr:FecR family protein [Methylophilus sp. QUAN]MBF4991357.1 FecR family protein [Methylophilus sp. QUAN]